VGRLLRGAGADRVAQPQVAPEQLVELARAQARVLGVALGDPPRPAAGVAVGLRLGGDGRLGCADARLHRVAELVRHHQRRDEPAEVAGQLAEEGSVVGDGVGVGGVGSLAVEGVVLRLQRPSAAPHDAAGVLLRVHVVRVDAEVAAGEGLELLAEDVGEGRAPEGLEVGEGISGELVDGIVGRAHDLDVAGRHVVGGGLHRTRPADDDGRAAGGAEQADERGQDREAAGPRGSLHAGWIPREVQRKPSGGQVAGRPVDRLSTAGPAPGGRLSDAPPDAARQPSCRNQTAPSGGTASVAEKGCPCQGSSTASTPPKLPTPEPP
jgi:hypothetical protein